jgi:hypothetical protein
MGMNVAFTDLAGNGGSTGINITRIDTSNPMIGLTYTPNTHTSGAVLVTLKTNEYILNPSGRTNI